MSVEQWKELRRIQKEATRWAEMFGEKYHGVGGGIGCLSGRGVLLNPHYLPEIYFQSCDGARNYHPMPATFQPFIEIAIRRHFGMLLKDALALLDESCTEAATKAAKEYKQLMDEAGLTCEENE